LEPRGMVEHVDLSCVWTYHDDYQRRNGLAISNFIILLKGLVSYKRPMSRGQIQVRTQGYQAERFAHCATVVWYIHYMMYQN
jgi:hypothetical protein